MATLGTVLQFSNNKLALAEALQAHMIRLPLIAEALVREEHFVAEDATPEASSIRQDALMARQRHMEEDEDIAFRNVERVADRIRAFESRQAVSMMNVTCACAFQVAPKVA